MHVFNSSQNVLGHPAAGGKPENKFEESPPSDAPPCSALQNLQKDPRYMKAWRTCAYLGDADPLKALHEEYGVEWIEKMVIDEKSKSIGQASPVYQTHQEHPK
jgi:hypothetical protein